MAKKRSEAELAKARAWKANNKDRVKAMRAAYYAANKEKELAASKGWAAANPEIVAGYREKDLESRRNDEYRAKARLKRMLNPEGKREIDRRYYHGDIRVKLRVRLTTLLNQALRRYNATSAAPLMELVGCSMDDFVKHMESKFKDGMSWDVVEKIHIDHRMPISSFDWSVPEQQFACFHFGNLQPLWDHENRTKHDNIPLE